MINILYFITPQCFAMLILTTVILFLFIRDFLDLLHFPILLFIEISLLFACYSTIKISRILKKASIGRVHLLLLHFLFQFSISFFGIMYPNWVETYRISLHLNFYYSPKLLLFIRFRDWPSPINAIVSPLMALLQF